MIFIYDNIYIINFYLKYMKNKMFLPSLVVVSLIFLGVGCNNTKDKIDTENNNKNVKTEGNQEETTTKGTQNGLQLSAEVLGNGQVKFNWTKTDDIKTDRERGFVLVRSNTENPVHDETNFWFRQSALKRENIWKDIPAGKQHFRICTLEKEKCSVYSNDVELDVK